MNKPPTKLESKILRDIRNFRSRNYGNSPSLNEIKDHLGFASTYAVIMPVNRLVAKNLLMKIGKRAFLVPVSDI